MSKRNNTPATPGLPVMPEVQDVPAVPEVQEAQDTTEIPMALAALAAVFETTAKDALLKVLTFKDAEVSAFTRNLRLSAKARASAMGQLLQTVRLLAESGQLEKLFNLATLDAKGDKDKGAMKLLKALEARQNLDSTLGHKLLAVLPIVIAE